MAGGKHAPEGKSELSHNCTATDIEMKLTICKYERFEVFMAVTMKNAIFWDVLLCGSCKNCLHHQGYKNRRARDNVSNN
jgi:hypothetical protein